VVQPFANTLVNMQLTGAQIKLALEQQWQPTGAARPFLRLGISKGFTYTYDPAAAAGSRITQMWLNGAAIDPAASYSVTVNSFLASGGDNFGAFATGADKRDTGQVDLQAMVDYMADNIPVAVDYTQRSVGVSFPAGAPAQYLTGQTVAFNLSSLAFSTAADKKDTSVSVKVGNVAVGDFAVDNTIGTDIFDEYGKASVSFVLPAAVQGGSQTVTITGNNTGTVTTVPLQVVTTTVSLAASAASQIYGSPNTLTLTATVTSSSSAPVTGTVDFVSGSQTLGSAPVSNGQATFTLPSDTPAGDYSVVAKYSGSSETPAADSAAVAVTVNKATATAILLATKTQYRQNPFLPALLFGAVVLNNGQPAKGNVLIKQDGVVVKTVPLTSGIFIWVVPRNLPKDTYEFVATYDPADDNNVSGVDSNGIFIQVR
jgi:5'-nucleotidase